MTHGILACLVTAAPVAAILLCGGAAAQPSADPPSVFEDHFDTLDQWICEGHGTIPAIDGTVGMTPAFTDAAGEPTYGDLNVWTRRPLPDHIRIAFDCTPLRAGWKLVFMLAANLRGGHSLPDDQNHRRDGHYVFITNSPDAFAYKPHIPDGKLVVPMDCCTIPYWRPDGWRIAVRMNPGHLLLQMNERAERKASADEPPHHLCIEKSAGRIRMWEDDQRVVDVADPARQVATAITQWSDGRQQRQAIGHLAALGAGHFGFRTLNGSVRFGNLRVKRLAESGETEQSAR